MRKLLLLFIVTLFTMNVWGQNFNVPVSITTNSDSPLTFDNTDNSWQYVRFRWTDERKAWIGLTPDNDFVICKENGGNIALTGENVGIGTKSPTLGMLQIKQSIDSNIGGLTITNSDVTRSIRIFTDGTNAIINGNSGGTIPLIFNQGGGNVGIGTTDPDYLLSVAGTIGCGEVIVEDVSVWADFVFEPNYNLMSLKELDNFIQENKHLPEIPTTQEVEENGISVGEMNAKLLQKIEELTLYTIQQQDLIENQKELIETLKLQMETQNKRITELEAKNN